MAWLVATLLLGALPPHWARAQAVSGSGDDAIPLPRGTTRVSVGGLWNDYADRYAPASERTVRWCDPALGIDWRVADPIVSEKDAAAPLLAEQAVLP